MKKNPYNALDVCFHYYLRYYQQVHPEFWEPGLEPMTLSSLLVTVAGFLMIYALSDPLNLTFLLLCVPHFKRVKYCLCSSTSPNTVHEVVAVVCLLKDPDALLNAVCLDGAQGA